MEKVSVIVLLYKPDLKKTLITLKSVLMQKNIDFEIVISDDGSEFDYFSEIEDYLKRNKFMAYSMVKNKENVGTVKNCLGALKKAVGKYVFLISPGDMLYDSDVLYDLYNFSESKSAKIAFGNAVFYNVSDKINVLSHMRNPVCPEYYSENNSVRKMYMSALFGNQIIGATYFRERKTALKYFSEIQSFAKYVEDTTSTLLAFGDDERIYRYDGNVVWYEFGTGVSTSGNDEWHTVIQNEVIAAMNKLKKKNPDDAVIDKAINVLNTNGVLKKILVLLNRPVVLWFFLILKLKSKFRRNAVEYDISKLENLLLTEVYENAGN